MADDIDLKDPECSKRVIEAVRGVLELFYDVNIAPNRMTKDCNDGTITTNAAVIITALRSMGYEIRLSDGLKK